MSLAPVGPCAADGEWRVVSARWFGASAVVRWEISLSRACDRHLSPFVAWPHSQQWLAAVMEAPLASCERFTFRKLIDFVSDLLSMFSPYLRSRPFPMQISPRAAL